MNTRRITSALATLALLGAGAPALSQTAGDVGADAEGNIYTYLVDSNGQGRWVRGRVGTGGTERTILAEQYIPSIWVDPDGCEHWVMDDGAEGYMTPHVNRHGRPVCRD